MGRRAAGLQRRAVHAVARHRRAHAVQSSDRRHREGTSGPRDRCAGRTDGPSDRRHRNTVQAAESQPRAGGVVAARPGGQARYTRTWVRDCARCRAEYRVDCRHGPGEFSSRRTRIVGLELEDGDSFSLQSARSSPPGRSSMGWSTSAPSSDRPGGGRAAVARIWRSRSSRFGFRWGRLKTGTPPRLRAESIDFDGGVDRGVFHVEHGDATPIPFSFRDRTRPLEPARACYLLHTTDACTSSCGRAHRRVAALQRPDRGIGPRYCPSLEDKVMRFPDRERHQMFLEPEGLDVEEIYVNGFSMSLPARVSASSCTRCQGSSTP